MNRRPASSRSKSMNSIHEILETVVAESLESEVNPAVVNEKLQRIQDHLKGRAIPPVTTVISHFDCNFDQSKEYC